MKDSLVLGRAPDCDVVVAEPSVSGRHARLRWQGSDMVIEDLGSANGVTVGGERVTTATIKAGDDVLLGGAALPWSDPVLMAFARRKTGGARRGDTVQATVTGRAYICGACGARGFLPRFVRRAEIQCGSCGAILELGGAKPAGNTRSRAWSVVTAISIVGIATIAVLLGREHIASAVREVGKDTGIVSVPEIIGEYVAPVGSPQEGVIRDAGIAERVVAAIDATGATTRNLSAQVASSDQGTFHVGQVAAIYTHVRREWRYVNDPRGNEYFARPEETITNDFAGDCDDYAILLVSMTEAIGGDARVVMSDGERGGHAYAEVCIPGTPEEAVTAINAHYRRARSRTRVRELHFRTDGTCQVWLNLDWYSQAPGGPYALEDWAVAIHPDGKTETLAPSTTPAPAE